MSGGNCGICIGSGRRNDVSGKGGIVSSAVFGVKHKRDVEYPRFKLCIAAVKAKHIKKILCGGE